MKRILSIDGGGLKGALPAAFLAEIEEATGKRIVDHFDLIAGTRRAGPGGDAGGVVAGPALHGAQAPQPVGPAPTKVHDELSADYADMIYAKTVEGRVSITSAPLQPPTLQYSVARLSHAG